MKNKTEKSDKPKVDLFKALDRLNNADLNFFNGLSPEDKKSLAPVVIMRWLSGTSDKKIIEHLNHLVNPLVFTMYPHQDLLFKLMMASGSGTSKRFKWIKKGTTPKAPIALDILKKYYQCSSLDAARYLPLHTKEDLIDIASAIGEDITVITKLKKE